MRRFRLRWSVRGLMLAAAGEAVLLAAGRRALRPALAPRAVSTWTLRLGAVPPRATGRTAWSVTNTGRAPLALFAQSWAASRVLGVVGGRDGFANGGAVVVPPGGKAEVVLEWETRDTLGPFIKGADVGTNGPRAPTLRFLIRGDVAPDPGGPDQPPGTPARTPAPPPPGPGPTR